MTIKEEIRALKYKQIKWALERANGNVREASRMIGANSSTFSRWMREVNLTKYAQTLRRKRDWWLATSVAEIVSFVIMVFYAMPVRA